MRAVRALGAGLTMFASRYWGVFALVAAWQLWVVVGDYNAIVLPGPTGVAAELAAHPGFYAEHTLVTASAAVRGLIIGMALGAACAALVWFTPLLDGLLTPTMVLLRSVPIVAIIPIVARLVGYGDDTVVVITVLLAFFPAFVFVASGLRAYPPGAVEQLRVLGCDSRWRTFRLLALPAAVPSLLTALRIGAPTAMLAALVAEFLMGAEGLGYLMMRARNELMMERSWGAALIATALSMLLYSLASAAETAGQRRWEA